MQQESKSVPDTITLAVEMVHCFISAEDPALTIHATTMLFLSAMEDMYYDDTLDRREAIEFFRPVFGFMQAALRFTPEQRQELQNFYTS